MARNESILAAPLPKPVIRIGTPIAAVLLTSFFIVLGFPYHHLTNRVAARVAATLGVEIAAAESGLTLGRQGPGFRFENVSVALPTGETYDLDSARFGAAWSLSWFVADPSFFFAVRSPLGTADGTFRFGNDVAWSGSISETSLTELTFLEQLLPFGVTGTLDARGDVATREGLPQGPLSFDLRDGSLSHPDIPLDIPYATIHGAVSFGGEQFVSIETFDLLGPMLNLSVSGTIGLAEEFSDRPLDLNVGFKDVAPQMRSIVGALGAKVQRDGTSQLHVTGTPGNPAFR